MPSRAVYSAVGKCRRDYGDGEYQEDGKDRVANPFGTAFVRVDIDVRHDQDFLPRGAGRTGIRSARRLNRSIW